MDIVSINGGRYKHSFYVSKLFFGFLIGSKGMVCKQLEQETKTSISIPRLGEDGDISEEIVLYVTRCEKVGFMHVLLITSYSQTAIISARDKINAIIESSKKKLRPTHFIAIPMRDEGIALNFEKFKNEVLNETGKNSEGVHDDIFQKPEKMHLTLGVLVLVDDEEIKSAIEALQECCETIIKPIVKRHNPIKIKAQGLEYFDHDPTAARVLFSKVSSENDVLQELSEKARDYLVQKGVMRQERQTLTLHLTMMNSSFAADKEKANFKTFKKFDVTNIMKIHKDYYFGENLLNTIHLCSFGEKAADGYYKITSKVDLVD